MRPYLSKTKRTFLGNEVFSKIKYLKGKLKRRLLKKYSENDKILVLDFTLQTRSSIKRTIKKEIINEIYFKI